MSLFNPLLQHFPSLSPRRWGRTTVVSPPPTPGRSNPIVYLDALMRKMRQDGKVEPTNLKHRGVVVEERRIGSQALARTRQQLFSRQPEIRL